MRVRYDEGVAIHVGPEPCVSGREARGEASAGDRAGQPLSRESLIVPDADAVTKAEGHRERGRQREPPVDPASSESPGMHARSGHGNREISRPTTGPQAVWSASGRRGAGADDPRTGEVRPRHRSGEAGEQRRATVRGVGGAKGGGRGERGSGPHAGRTRLRTGQACHRGWTAYGMFRRQTPKVGAECPNWARSDLCGGRSLLILLANSGTGRL